MEKNNNKKERKRVGLMEKEKNEIRLASGLALWPFEIPWGS